jgi:hypothetical protein
MEGRAEEVCGGLGLECLGERTARASEGQGHDLDLVGRDFGGCASVQVLRLFGNLGHLVA